jgi:hypothetical protein
LRFPREHWHRIRHTDESFKAGEEAGAQRIDHLKPSGRIKLHHGRVGQIEGHPKPVARHTGVVIHRDTFVTQPNASTIAGDGPVGHLEGLQGLLAPFIRSDDAIAVGWIQDGLPEVRRGALLDRIAKRSGHLVADMRP